MSTPDLERIVIVGASLAGLRTAEELRAQGFTGELVMVGDEPLAPYDRPPLSKGLLAGELEPEEIALRTRPELGAVWKLGVRATSLDTGRQTVMLAGAPPGGTELSYDALVVATGARARSLPCVPDGLPGVVSLRAMDDALALRAFLAGRPRVGVIGAGFIGTEVASTCRSLGLQVTVFTAEPPLLRGLGPLHDIGTELLETHGVELRAGVAVAGVRGSERVEAVLLGDGTEVPVDVLVVAVGAVPNTEWLAGSGLEVRDGVVTDAWCAVVGADRVFALGDVARWPNALLGGELCRAEHWTNAVEQATVTARTLMHGRSVPYRPVPSFWTDQFGLRIQGLGEPGRADRAEIVQGSRAERKLVAEMYRGDELVGVVALDSPRPLVPYRARLLAQAVVEAAI
ncbi:NAD(P)/FAD-dependent oxidoreductase [Streptomyces puniciscabiei]